VVRGDGLSDVAEEAILVDADEVLARDLVHDDEALLPLDVDTEGGAAAGA
jgi:hypothetical protein